VGAITEGSGAVNEDGFGMIGTAENVSAAWVFDGVTGVNERNYLPAGSDAQWLVARAQEHLLALAITDELLPEILRKLVNALIMDWQDVSSSIEFPQGYDPPATCLTLVKRYESGWHALRLGDSCLLARREDGIDERLTASPNNDFDHWLSSEAKKRRAASPIDIKVLLAEFRPLLIASRKTRNTKNGYSILEADIAATFFAEYLSLGEVAKILICTDGFYRAVDHYGLYDNRSLLGACNRVGGVDTVLAAVRSVEASDPQCEEFIRFKSADDATAIMLTEDWHSPF
jgi:serine/threonine protein phosphatase PrpC